MIKAFLQQSNCTEGKAILVGIVPFVDLINKVLYTYRKESNESLDKYIEYQRKTDPTRVRDISEFIRKQIMNELNGVISPLFPTSIILAFNNDEIDIKGLNKVVELDLQNISSSNQSSSDLDDNKILIVDGQHRYFGMLYLYENLKKNDKKDDLDEKVLTFIENYCFNCTILVNFDLWEQAQVFATVNFNQKKVNKSLFYDIYGIRVPEEYSIVPRQNEIYISHQLVKFLAKDEKSPLNGFIKMLGVGRGFVSQAFFVEQLLELFKPSSIWGYITEDLKRDKLSKSYSFAAIELSAYLTAIFLTFKEYWPASLDGKPNSLICKTTGLGALMRFLVDIHNSVDTDKMNEFKNNINSESYRQLVDEFYSKTKRLKPFGKEFFSLEEGYMNPYSGGAGKGMQLKLYSDIYNKWLNCKD